MHSGSLMMVLKKEYNTWQCRCNYIFEPVTDFVSHPYTYVDIVHPLWHSNFVHIGKQVASF
jgi:hypothetical protein